MVPRVLLVEDDFLLAFPVEQFLLDEGFEVEVVNRGEEAIKLLHRERFDALITDIRLGPGPDGWEVGQRARDVHKGIPVFYMTADSAVALEAKGVPNSTLLRKPFAIEDLTNALSEPVPSN